MGYDHIMRSTLQSFEDQARTPHNVSLGGRTPVNVSHVSNIRRTTPEQNTIDNYYSNHHYSIGGRDVKSTTPVSPPTRHLTKTLIDFDIYNTSIKKKVED